MPQHRDNRYRGRARKRTAPPKRKPGHLRTNYTIDDPCYFFSVDMKTVRSVWPEEVIKDDSRAVRKKEFKVICITLAVLMVPLTVLAVWFVIDHSMPWWIIPAAQTAFLLYFGLMMFVNTRGNRDENIDIIIHREADRRGIKYTKDTPLYALMNKINADYNSYLWNRNFKWE